MTIDIGRLEIDSIIVHEVPLRQSTREEKNLFFSEVESPLTIENKNFFRERVTRSLSSSAFDVMFDPEATSPVPNFIFQLLYQTSHNFVDFSQKIARHLYSCQNLSNSPGLLAIMRAHVGVSQVLSILKLEKEEGVRVHQEEIDGQKTFAIEQFSDLMMTDGTRVFKIGLFFNLDSESETIQGRVSDKQQGYSGGISDFFLSKFLGCKLVEAPMITTKNFFDSTERFINQELSDSQKKADYSIALLATLKSQESIVKPRLFANQYMEVADRQKYIQFLSEDGIPTREFQKDTSKIKNHIRKVQMEFQSGVILLGSPETLEENIKVTSLEDERIRIELEDKLKKTSGK